MNANPAVRCNMSSSLSPRTASLIVVLFFFAFSNIYAAETTATLGGTVKDSSGAVVTGATVTLTEATTNTSRSQQTNPDGAYSFTLVPVGRYQVAVESSGFRKYVQSGIQLEGDQNGRADVTLRAGAR